jgi:hypothetical protein
MEDELQALEGMAGFGGGGGGSGYTSASAISTSVSTPVEVADGQTVVFGNAGEVGGTTQGETSTPVATATATASPPATAQQAAPGITGLPVTSGVSSNPLLWVLALGGIAIVLWIHKHH